MNDTPTTTNGSTAPKAPPVPGPDTRTPAATAAKPQGSVDGSGRKPGRPRAPTPDDSLPRILSAARSRSTMSVVMGAPTARDLKQYIEWAASKINMPPTEAMIVVLDQAIGEFLAGDRAWLKHKKEFLDSRESD